MASLLEVRNVIVKILAIKIEYYQEKERRIDELRAEIQTKNDQLQIRDREFAAHIEVTY